MRSLAHLKLACIGPSTAAALEHWHLRADVVPGEYRVEVIPPMGAPSADGASAALGLSPMRLAQTLPGDLGTVTLQGTVMATTSIEVTGEPLPGAVLECTETGYGRRTTRATADELGELEIELPRAQVACTVTPPASEAQSLAIRHLPSGGPDSVPEVIALGPGALFEGRVVAPDGTAEPYAWVEVVDVERDLLLAYGVSGENGRFQLRGEILPAPSTTTTLP